MSATVRAFAVTFSPTGPSPRVAAVTKPAVLVAQATARARRSSARRSASAARRRASLRKRRMRATKSRHVLVGKCVVERQHRDAMRHLGKFLRWPAADPARRRIGALEMREPLLDGEIAPPQRVVFGIRDRRRRFLVVKPVIFGDQFGEPLQLLRRVGLAQFIDGSVALAAMSVSGFLEQFQEKWKPVFRPELQLQLSGQTGDRTNWSRAKSLRNPVKLPFSARRSRAGGRLLAQQTLRQPPRALRR